jgi:SAM-dependent methyltransferase
VKHQVIRPKFAFNGKEYKYFFHLYNFTWKTERAIEIPIILDFTSEYKKKNVLEVGNVLSHYFNISHDVLDKYEIARGVMNEDAETFQTDKRYDLIVSISTFEHIGFDEKPSDPEKLLRAVENLRSLLTPDGRIIFTVPLGYNPMLLLPPVDEAWYMKRTDLIKWEQEDHLPKGSYGAPYPCGNGLMVGVILGRASCSSDKDLIQTNRYR